jgi:carbamoyltransferase
MLILGLSGGEHLPQEVATVGPQVHHDAAAVLIEDGRIVAGIEEERLNRIKHTNHAPLYSPRFCLRFRGISGVDIDHVAFYLAESGLDDFARRSFLADSTKPVLRPTRDAFRSFFAQHLGISLPPERFHFVPHHLAHAVSAFALSGYDESLIVTLDGEGDEESCLVAVGDRQGTVRPITSFTNADSVGLLYERLIRFLGYKTFDEYKVMGLAPYGDPAVFGDAFKELYTLLPDGRWEVHRQRILALYSVLLPRRKGEDFTQAHKDFAAALQAVVERIVLHALTYQRIATGQRNLCLAGGVAHNCTMTGRILASGLFDRVFVQPAAHDAGAALGAALEVYRRHRRASRTSRSRGLQEPSNGRLEHVYWGSDIGSAEDIRRTLESWHRFVTFRKVEDVCTCAAALIAEGAVIGWAQGRSEFGPRALGNRSILADPRPARNKWRINAMVKKRESYRPFAPSVLAENVAEYFVVPDGAQELSYMTFAVTVRKEKRDLLGAVTHVDGSARVQTVSRETNDRYWRLIDAFRKLTGLPVLLNTSFNNNVEPIVDSIEDAVVCFLTTGLQYLVVGDWVVQKKSVPLGVHGSLVVTVPPHYRLIRTKATGTDWAPRHIFELVSTHDAKVAVNVSPETYEVLLAADGLKTVGDIIAALGYGRDDADDAVLQEIRELWSLRTVVLRPLPTVRDTQPVCCAAAVAQ